MPMAGTLNQMRRLRFGLSLHTRARWYRQSSAFPSTGSLPLRRMACNAGSFRRLPIERQLLSTSKSLVAMARLWYFHAYTAHRQIPRLRVAKGDLRPIAQSLHRNCGTYATLVL